MFVSSRDNGFSKAFPGNCCRDAVALPPGKDLDATYKTKVSTASVKLYVFDCGTDLSMLVMLRSL